MTLIVVLYMLFALTFTLAKSVLFYVKPLAFIGMRMTFAGAIMFVLLALRGQLRYQKGSWILLIQSILFHVFFAYTGEFWALQYISSSKTALIYNASPFITAFLSILLLSERIKLIQWIGLIIGFMGMVPVFLSVDRCEQIFGPTLLSFPELVLLCAVVSSCYGWIVMKQLLDRYNYTPLHVNALSMGMGGILSLIISYCFESRPLFFEGVMEQGCLTDMQPFGWHALGALLFYGALLVLIANGICYNLYGYLLHRYSATFLSFAGFLCPLFAAFFGFVFLSETISFAMVVGFLMLLVGLALFYRGERILDFRK